MNLEGIRAALLAMPDRKGSTATIAGVDVERTGAEGWIIFGAGGGVEWAATYLVKHGRRL